MAWLHEILAHSVGGDSRVEPYDDGPARTMAARLLVSFGGDAQFVIEAVFRREARARTCDAEWCAVHGDERARGAS